MSPLIVLPVTDSEDSFDPGPEFALAIGYRSEIAAIELIGGFSRPEIEGQGRTDRRSTGLNFMLAPLQGRRYLRDAHLLLGYAVTREDGEAGEMQGSGTDVLDLGLGYTPGFQVMGLNFGTRLELLYRQDRQRFETVDSPRRDVGDLVVRIGLHIPLGARPPVVPEPDAEFVKVVPPAD